jgi:hypothetical protein
MRRLITLVLASGVALGPIPQAHAGKVESVKRAVKDKCNKEVPIDILLDSVVKAYDCQPDQEVTINSCKIKCLKGSSGNVVGQ